MVDLCSQELLKNTTEIYDGKIPHRVSRIPLEWFDFAYGCREKP